MIFRINWSLNLETFIFCQFIKILMIIPLIKKSKIDKKEFFFSNIQK